MHIAIDIDCTIYDLHPHMQKAVEDLGVPLPRDSILWYDNWTVQLSKEQMKMAASAYHSDTAILGNEPYPCAVECIQRWIRDDHRITMCTTRSDDRYKVTRQWLDTIGLQDCNLRCFSSHSKVEGLDDDVELVIDDHANTMVEAMLSERKVAAIEQPWNCNFRAVKCCVVESGWKALANEISKRGWL